MSNSTAQPGSARLDQLRKMLERSPQDAFLLYATAIELKNLGSLAEAIGYLDRTLAVDADYLYAYYQKGQILEQQDEPAAAIAAYDLGMTHAKARGDNKAWAELKHAKDLLD